MLEIIKDFFMGSSPKATNYLYGFNHILTLVLTIVFATFLVLYFKNKTEKSKYRVITVIAGILLFFEILHRVVSLIKGKDFITTMVPLHFCSIMVWIMIVAVFSKSKHLLSLAAIGGFLATVSYLAYPAVGLNAITIKFSDFYSIFSHCLGFVLSVYLLFSGFVSYKWKDIWMSFAFLVFVFIYSAIFNFVVYPGSNYMYYVESPFSFIKAPYFQIAFLAVVLIYIFSFYIVYNLRAKRKETFDNSN